MPGWQDSTGPETVSTLTDFKKSKNILEVMSMTKQKVIHENAFEKIVQYTNDEHGAKTTYTQRFQKVYGKTKDGKIISKWIAV